MNKWFILGCIMGIIPWAWITIPLGLWVQMIALAIQLFGLVIIVKVPVLGNKNE